MPSKNIYNKSCIVCQSELVKGSFLYCVHHFHNEFKNKHYEARRKPSLVKLTPVLTILTGTLGVDNINEVDGFRLKAFSVCKNYLHILSHQEIFILYKRLFSTLSMQKIGAILEISKQRVFQIELSVANKLKKAINENSKNSTSSGLQSNSARSNVSFG